MLQITVDLTSERSLLVKVAQLILQFAGYEPAAKQPDAEPSQRLARVAADPYADAEDRGDAAGAIDFGATEPSRADALVAEGKAITRADTTPPPEQAFASQVPDSYTSQRAERFESAHLPLTVPQVPPPPPPAGIDVDKNGLPWDPRIHAATRAKIADGSWRQKRGVDPALLATVEAELRATMNAPTPLAAGVGGNLTVRVPMPPLVVASPVPPVPEVPQVPPPPSAGSVVPPAPPSTGTPPVPVSAGVATTASPGSGAPTFVQLMQAITKGFTTGSITQAQITESLATVQLAALPMLAMRPDLVPAVATALGIAL